MGSPVDIPWSRYIPHVPTPKQHAFLWLQIREAFFGGAAGGGKSDAMLMAALQYVDVPGYSAIIFRKSYTDLSLPGAIMTRGQEWLLGTDAKWNDNDKEFVFPSGAKLNFSYLAKPNDKYRYQSAEFQFIGWDELTQFDEDDYLYLMSRLRRPSEGPLSAIPLRSRGAANPGGVGHVWVKKRFVDGQSPERIFIPSALDDNPHLDQASYEQSLALLDPITHAQLRHGDWAIRPPGLWTFDHRHVEASIELGRRLRKDPPQPARGYVASGVDFGDFQTVLEPIIEIERGGIWVPPGEVITTRADLEDITDQFIASMTPYRKLGWWKEIRYDSSFAQSARTVGKLLETEMGRHNPVTRVGRPSMVPVSFKDYKQLAIKYLRLLMRNSYDGKPTRVLAIDPQNEKLGEQLQTVQQKETNPDLIEKGNDDTVDALIAGAYRLAVAHRNLIEELERRATRSKSLDDYKLNQDASLDNIDPNQRAA